MSSKQSPNLVSSLRMMDEHWGQTNPNPAFEQRLLLQLQRPAKEKLRHFLLLAWMRQYRRPLVLVFAAALVLVLSVSDTAPNVRSGLLVPQMPDAAVEPVETPLEERFEPANPHLPDEPTKPRIVPLDPSDPRHLDSSPENQLLVPVPPEQEWEPEQTLVEPKSWKWDPRTSSPKSTARDPSDVRHFWSPGQTLPSDLQSRSPNNSGQSGSGSSSRPKPPAATSSLPCLTKEALKNRAAAACEENGLTLSDIMYVNPCKNGLFQHAEHECAEPSSEEDPCTTGTVSDGEQCVDPGQLKNLAYTACKMALMDLVDFTYSSGDCGWKTRKATYTCCPFPTPDPPSSPPPPMVCQGETIGDGVTCMDPGKMKEEAYYLCQGLGQMLMDIVPANDCPNGLSTIAKISCCTQ